MATTKVYYTYAQINKDLEILKVEKDIAYHKLMKEVDETKESLEFKNLIGDGPKKVLNVVGMLGGPLKSAALTFLFKKFF